MTELYFIVNKKTKEILTHAKSEFLAKELLWSWQYPEDLKICKSKVDMVDIGTYEWKAA